MERIPELARRASNTLAALGFRNITIHMSEETLGWPEGAPYDAILVAAGAPCVPDDLLSQLAIGGRLVIPIGSRFIQELYKITKLRRGNIVEKLCGCVFVPLIGKGAWEQ